MNVTTIPYWVREVDHALILLAYDHDMKYEEVVEKFIEWVVDEMCDRLEG